MLLERTSIFVVRTLPGLFLEMTGQNFTLSFDFCLFIQLRIAALRLIV